MDLVADFLFGEILLFRIYSSYRIRLKKWELLYIRTVVVLFKMLFFPKIQQINTLALRKTQSEVLIFGMQHYSKISAHKMDPKLLDKEIYGIALYGKI